MVRTPLVSILIPVRNEEAYLSSCLNAILAQDYPLEAIEAIVIDGMSTDQTRQVVQQFIQDHPEMALSLLENPESIYSTGFNIGLRQARGKIIIMLGGHTELAPNYISRCVELLGRHSVECIGGSMDTIPGSPSAATIAVAMSSRFGVGDVAFRTQIEKTQEVDTAAFAAYRREVFLKNGMLDEEMVRNQDDEYNYRLRENGGRILLAPELRTYYHSRASLRSLWKQYFQYGFYKVRVLQKHPAQMRPRQFVPPLFVGALLASSLLALLVPQGWLPLALVGGSYLLANLAASLLTASQRGWRHLPFLPIAFAILHLSYGLGFLLGLVRFANRWGDRQGRTPQWEAEKTSG